MTKRRSVKNLVTENNTRKINKALSNKVFINEPIYSICIVFTLTKDQDMNDPIYWLKTKMGVKLINKLNDGSGTCLMTGLRDFTFSGTKSEMTDILNNFAHSEFKINSIYSDLVGFER